MRQRLREKIEFLRQNRSENESKKGKKQSKKRKGQEDKKSVQPQEKRIKVEKTVVEEKQTSLSSPTPSVNDVISKYFLIFLNHVAFNLVRFELQKK